MQRKAFTDPFGGKTGIFFITSSHLETELLFRDENDYRHGVNSLALCQLGLPVSLLCYVLMGNHIHLLVRGCYTDCMAYYDKVILRVTARIGRERKRHGLLKKEDVDIQAVGDRKQLLNIVIYILRNPYRAQIASPFSYEWSSIDCYFNLHRNLRIGTPIEASSGRKLRVLLGTRENLPPEWRIHDGRIVNTGFVDGSFVENAFGSSWEFFSKMRIYDVESAIKLAGGAAEKLTFTDAELREKMFTICQAEYHVAGVNQLDRKTLFMLARTLARRFGAGKKQIARLTGIPLDSLDAVL